MSRRHYKVSVGGLLPAGYAECEYIESTGTQYIDTETLAGSDVELHTDFKFADILGNYGEGADNWNGGGLRFRYDLVEVESHQYYGFRTMVHNDTKRIYTPPDTEWHDIAIKSGSIILDGNIIQTASIPSGLLCYNIHLFAIITPNNAQAKSKMRKTQCIIKRNGYAVRHFIPALRISDNKPGLYDLCGSICPLTGTPFYVNAGTGEFLYQLKS